VRRRHGEAVCVAGFDLDNPRWIRLYPVPFRDLPFAQRFRKFDIVELEASESSDPRPESYKPNADSIRVVGHLNARRAVERRRHIEPLMRQSMCAIRREQQESRASLGIFRPLAPPELRIVEERSAWEPEKQMIVGQPSMLMPGKKGLEKLPFRFSYRYGCAGEPTCPGHEQSIIDWEIAEAFRKWRDRLGEHRALEHIEERWTRDLWAPERDSAVIVGNQFKSPQGFLILGVFWPPRLTTGLGSGGPAQGELLPPR
jgi:hypothetical protein